MPKGDKNVVRGNPFNRLNDVRDDKFINQTKLKSALLRAGVESTVIDQILQDEAAKKLFACKVERVATLQDYVVVELKGDVEDGGLWLDVSFPPNDNSFLDELKRAQNHDLWVRGMFFVGPTTGDRLLLYIQVIDYHSAEDLTVF